MMQPAFRIGAPSGVGVSRVHMSAHSLPAAGRPTNSPDILTAIPRLEAPDFEDEWKNNDWGNRLLVVYRVNWSIVLFS